MSDAENNGISNTIDKLAQATHGDTQWHWHSDGYYRSDTLPEPIADRLLEEFEGLDVKVGRNASEGPTVLSISYTEAEDFITRDAVERGHVETPRDELQAFLSRTYPELIWEARGQGTFGAGYVGYGYDLARETAIKSKLRADGAPATKTDLSETRAETNHEGPTHGLFVSNDAVKSIMQSQARTR